MAGHQQSGYISLRQAEQLAADPVGLPQNCFRNIFAVVTECTVPRPTAGPGEDCSCYATGAHMHTTRALSQALADYVSNLTLSDATLDAGEPSGGGNGVNMLCFAAQAHNLPKIQLANDIIRLHRVRVRCLRSWHAHLLPADMH